MLLPRAIDLLASVSVLLIVGTATVQDFILPVPLGLMFISMFVSHQVPSSIGQFPVDALLIVNSLTAPATEVSGNLINSLLHPSFIRLCDAPSNVIQPLIITASEVALLNQLCPDAFNTIVLSVLTPVIIPVSQTITVEFCSSLPVVASKRAIALSVALAGHTTSQVPPAVLAIVTIPSAPVPVVVRVIFAPSTSLILPPVAESVAVWDVPSEVFVIV